jgi:pimeloyl-ACP methyl ester carboxylesterase
MRRTLSFLAVILLLAACNRAQMETTPEATASPEPAPATDVPPTPTDAPPPTDAPTVAPTEEALPVDATPLDGQWEGAIDIGGTQLDIIVKFDSSIGALTATIDIPQQGAVGLPLDDVSLDGDAVHFAIGSVGAVFDGAVDGETISGDFAQAGATGTFTLTRTGDVVAATATPVPPYAVEEVTWALDDTTVSATLTRPEGDGPFPAVVFVAGSGPTDRDWNSPLLPGRNGSAALLADELTRAGYATLRYDKRFTGPFAQENMPALLGNISFQSHLDELTSAVDFLVAQPGIDPARLFVLANSEGTLHAMNYQASDPAAPFAGLILTGAPGRPMTEVLHQQMAENVLAAEPNRDELLTLWDEAIAAFVAGETAELDPALPESAQQVWAGLTAPANQPFSAELLAAQPTELLAEIDAPALVIIGQKDIQVDWEADGAVLEAAAGDNVTFSYPPNANHVLKLEEKPAEELTAADGATYNAADRVLDPETVQIILDWLSAQ